ncbi:MAG: N,N-dimethylformamidase beta subunit family domain-containing protein [Nitrososphaeraceae archaeon]
MSKTEQRSRPNLKFVISILIILVSFSLLCTHSALGKAQLGFTAKASSNYSLPLLLHSMSNNSIPNTTSLAGSALSITKSMRNLNETIPEPGERPYIAENKNYVFSQNRTEISSPNNNSHTGEFRKGVKIAVVMPTFTAAAYNNAFYTFYEKYTHSPRGLNITTDLNLLSSKVTNEPSSSASGFAMVYLLGNLKWIRPDSNIAFLTDQDVDAGSVFQGNGNNAYDVVILGHQEYVTQREYDNFKQFVGDGGTMIILDGNVFYAQVKYDSNTGNITLVKGHGWAFNGLSAWKSVNERWK